MDSELTYALIIVILYVPALILLAIVLVANVGHLRNLSPSSILILGMCFGDFVHATNDLTISITHLATGSMDYKDSVCQGQAIAITFGALFNICQCTGLTLFRYLSIVLKMKLKTMHAYIFTGAVAAICAFTTALPFILGSKNTYGLHPSHVVCTVIWYSHDRSTQIVSWLAVVVLSVPLSGLWYAYLVIYFQVAGVLKEAKRINMPSKTPKVVEVKRMNQDISKTVREDTVQEEQARKYEKKQHKLLIQSIAIVSVMLLGWGPYCIMVVVEIISGQPVSPAFEYIAETLVVLNELFNPIVVMMFDAEIRKNVMALFFWN